MKKERADLFCYGIAGVFIFLRVIAHPTAEWRVYYDLKDEQR